MRDLLADGLMTPEGDGDVLIWPSSPVIGPDGQTDGPLSVLNIKLSSPFGEGRNPRPRPRPSLTSSTAPSASCRWARNLRSSTLTLS